MSFSSFLASIDCSLSFSALVQLESVYASLSKCSPHVTHRHNSTSNDVGNARVIALEKSVEELRSHVEETLAQVSSAMSLCASPTTTLMALWATRTIHAAAVPSYS